jgi:hypothetical protein
MNRFMAFTAAAIAFMAILAMPFTALSGDCFIRYRLQSPANPSYAKVRFQPHSLGAETHVSWEGVPLPGNISYSQLFVPAGKWSEWYEFPDKKGWGTVYLDIVSIEPLKEVATQIQVATWPEEKSVVKTLDISSKTGGSVGFMLPPNLLDKPEWLESLPDGQARRMALATELDVHKKGRAPELFSFTPSGVADSPTIAGAYDVEREIVRKIGMNTDAVPAKKTAVDMPFFILHNTGGSEEHDGKAKKQIDDYNATVEVKGKSLYTIMTDEPGWNTGFNPIWAKTGNDGFLDYLRKNNVQCSEFGAKTYDEIKHIGREKPVAADAPLNQRKLWYWSCRYTYDTGAEYFLERTQTSRKTFPDTLTTVNFPDHSILMNSGMIAAYGPDYFAFGRKNALTMYWTEDWMFSGINSWGNGLYQKVGYLGELLRAAARYHEPKAQLGFHVVGMGYNPFSKETDRTFAMRTLLLAGKGVKIFSFFKYGPTSQVTVDFSSDDAPAIRGIADATQLVGAKNIEPYLYAGQPLPASTCIIFGTTAEYWQAQNKMDDNNKEKQHLYCMLTQEQVPTEIIDSFDLSKFIRNYKCAYFVDMNIRKESAENLMAWVKDGGTLCLWPGAASKDEYNEPLKLFPEEAGKSKSGKGLIVRLDEYPGKKWWENTKKMCADANSGWPSIFDRETSAGIAAFAKPYANPPVTVSANGVIADALVSTLGTAVTLVNLQGTYDKGGARYLNLKVVLRDGKDIKKAWSSRQGDLPMSIEGGGQVSVTLPLMSTDIVVFSKN